jgi:HEAT repeat protein
MVVVAALLPGAAGSVRAFDEVIDSPMYRSPDLPVPPVETVFPEGLKELWLRALKRPEVEMRTQAAVSISRAHLRGMKGLDVAVPDLVALLDAPDQHPAVRLAAAKALVDLGARQAAPNLLARAQAEGAEFREAVEPALASWDHRPARTLWLARLDAPATPVRSLVLAIRALAVVREEQAVPALLKLTAAGGASAPVRLEAARALGAIRASGLEKDAEALASDNSSNGLVGRLAAAHLLSRHSGPDAVALLQRLARDPEPAVTAVAADRLIALDPELAAPLLDQLLGSPAPDVRSLGVEALFRAPTGERVRRLGDRLGDAHPDVRKKTRQHLRELAAKDAFKPRVLEEGTRVLAGNDWRGLEQATILLTQLEHRPSADRFVELLTAARPEVFITAAWGLRKLAVPGTLTRVRQYVEDELGRLHAMRALAGRKNDPELIDHQLSQLNQFMGLERYQEAEPLLRKFVPKQGQPGGESRGAAIWALGLLHEGKADAVLATELEGRITDNGVPPELDQVRWMAAVTLGRMKATQSLPTLRKFVSADPGEGPVANVMGWAVAQITGETLRPPEPHRRTFRDWFLGPHP